MSQKDRIITLPFISVALYIYPDYNCKDTLSLLLSTFLRNLPLEDEWLQRTDERTGELARQSKQTELLKVVAEADIIHHQHRSHQSHIVQHQGEYPPHEQGKDTRTKDELRDFTRSWEVVVRDDRDEGQG